MSDPLPRHTYRYAALEAEAAIQQLLRSGASLQLQSTSRTQDNLELAAPPFPAELRPQLTRPYSPVCAA